MALFPAGKSWVTGFFLRRGWLVKRRLKSRLRSNRSQVPIAIPAECLEDRTLLSTITVTTLADNVTPDLKVTLREAIQAANTDLSVDGSVAGDSGTTNQIVFAPGLSGTISLELGELSISSPMTIQGLGAAATVIDAQHNSRIFEITSGTAGDVTLDRLTLKNGSTTDAGAAGGGAGDGGAIQSLSTGGLFISNSTLSGDATTGDHASGGAVYSAIGAVTVTNSTLSANSTSGQFAFGGAIFSVSGTVTLTNSTLSGNQAPGTSSYGGAVASYTGAIRAVNSTITRNYSTIGGGLATLEAAASITLTNTIVAQNTDKATSAPDLYLRNAGTLTVSSSLIGDNAGTGLTPAPVGSPDGSGNLIGTTGALIDPMLGDLNDNGGATQTMALLAGSPAIDAGNSAAAIDPVTFHTLDTDQRGAPFVRGTGTSVDIGAYEFQTLLTPLVVTSADDALDAVFNLAHLTLRDAVALADGSAGPDTITFAPSLNGVPILLTLGQMVITETVTIDGISMANTVIDAQGTSRIFQITSAAGDVTFNSLTLQRGKTTATFASGAAINDLSTGALSIVNSKVTGNTTTGNFATGGAVSDNRGDLYIANSVFSQNSTSGYYGYGGAIGSQFGTLSITGSSFTGNFTGGYDAGGGAIAAYTLTVSDTTFTANYTYDDRARGGAITALRDVTITGSTFSNNFTQGRFSTGGAVDVLNGDLHVSQSTLSGNFTEGRFADGGAIYNDHGSVTVSQTTLSYNYTSQNDARGGAISCGGAAVTVTSSTLSGNFTQGRRAIGGAIAAYLGVVVTNSTISGNSTSGSLASGGAIYTDKGPVTVTNSTIAENHAYGAIGGGIYGFNPSVVLTLTNSILALDTDGGTAPDLYLNAGATVTVTSSLVGNNTGTTLAAAPVDSPDGSGNLIGTGLVPIDPLLGALANNGGPTQTMALLAGSPALNAGNSLLAADPGPDGIPGNGDDIVLTSDQRGGPFARVFGAAVDMGAYESQSLSLVVNTTDDTLDAVYNPAHLTLRDALPYANANPGADSITFNSSLNGLPINLALGEITVSDTVTITGNGAGNTIVDGQQNSRIFKITGGAGNVTLTALTLQNASSTTSGGAILSNSAGTLSIVNSRLAGNSTQTGTTARGGAIYDAAGPVVVTGSTLSGNFTVSAGGDGGAIAAAASLTLTSSTLSGNSSHGGRGGAIFSSGALTIINSTLAGNSTTVAGANGFGGAIFASAAVKITDATIVQNQATNATGGGIALASGSIALKNSILAQNSDSGVAPDLYAAPGAVVAVTRSLIGDNTGSGLTAAPVGTPDANGNLIGTGLAPINPLLGGLANNGGLTRTMAILTGSPAAGAGAIFNDSSNNPITVDQRGNTRFAGGVDMGAYQSPTVASIVRFNPATSPVNTSSVTFTVTFNEPVQHVSTGSFTVNAGTVGVAPVSSSIYHVTVNGLTAFTGTLTLGFSSGQAITDLAGGLPLVNTRPTGSNVNTYAVDTNPPVFTSAGSVIFAAGLFGSFTVAAGSLLPVTLSESVSDVLPSGVTFIAGTGVLSGTPAVGTNGNYVLHFTAANGNTPNTPQTFTLKVTSQFPFAGEYGVTTGSGSPTLASITQSSSTLTLHGASTTNASITDATRILVNGTDTATYVNSSIVFTTGAFAGQTWTKLDLPANFTNQQGAATHVVPNGAGVTFVDKFGNTSPGTWVSPTQLSATSWGETVTIGTGTLIWQDGSIWSENLTINGTKNGNPTATISAAPSRLYVFDYHNGVGQTVHLIQSGTSNVIFIDSTGLIALGNYINLTQATSPVYPNDVATISNDFSKVTWTDGATWTRTAPTAAVTVTDYTNQLGAPVHLVQNGTSHVVVVDGQGRFALGTMQSPTTALFPLYPNDLATISSSTVVWQDGYVWTKVSGGAPLVAGFVDNTGALSHVQFVSATTLLGLDGPLEGLTGTRVNNQIEWSNGAVWANFDFNAINALFEMATGYP